MIQYESKYRISQSSKRHARVLVLVEECQLVSSRYALRLVSCVIEPMNGFQRIPEIYNVHGVHAHLCEVQPLISNSERYRFVAPLLKFQLQTDIHHEFLLI